MSGLDSSLVIMQGYLLKKKRKKLQGMARRYFTLTSTGALSYSFNPGTPVRDSIFISLAYVSASRKSRSFHIDSGSSLYLCKCLTEGDFDRWTEAFKKFVGTVVQEPSTSSAQNHPHHHHHSRKNGDTRNNSRATAIVSNGIGGEFESEVDLITIFTAIARMTAPLQELDSIYTDLKSHSAASSSSTTSPPPAPSSSSSAQSSPLKFLSGGKRRAKSNATEISTTSTTSSHSTTGSSSSTGGTGTGGAGVTGTGGDYFDLKPNQESLLKSLGLVLKSLKSQHEVLVNALNEMPKEGIDSLTSHHGETLMSDGTTSTTSLNLNTLVRSIYNVPSNRSSPTSATNLNSTTLTGGIISGGSSSPQISTPPRTLSRASSFSMNSGETDDYYVDASQSIHTPAGEFFMEEEEDGSEYYDGSGIGRSDSESTTRELKEAMMDDESSSGSDEGNRTRYSNFEDEEEEDSSLELGGKTSSSSLKEDKMDQVLVKRRTELPAPVSGDEFSMLSMLRKNVGKDLSTISFPVTFNEPLSALQRITEDFEYSELLTRAAALTGGGTENEIERMALVVGFVVSGSASNKFRSSRKPFNPLLGETYECVRPDKGFKFISEKVSHHPPIMAFYSEGKGWKVQGHVAPSQKFWGRSMEILVSGEFDIIFEDTGETFSVRKPSSFVRNLVAGTKYLEIVGDLLITTSSPPVSPSSSSSPLPSHYSAIVTYKEGSTWGGASSRNKIEGKIMDRDGKVKGEVVGRWDECLDLKEGGGERFRRLWSVGEWSSNPAKYYGFSPFSITLNEQTSLESSLAPTDSRLRPDQLALERGDIDEAESTKKRVEEKQREKRSEGKEAGKVWFEKNKEGGEGWRYKGEYFEKKEKNDWIDPDIF